MTDSQTVTPTFQPPQRIYSLTRGSSLGIVTYGDNEAIILNRRRVRDRMSGQVFDSVACWLRSLRS